MVFEIDFVFKGKMKTIFMVGENINDVIDRFKFLFNGVKFSNIRVTE